MNLIKALLIARDPEAYYRKNGWGRAWTYPVIRPGGEDMVLTARVPLDWKVADVREMPPEAAATAGSLAHGMAMLAKEFDAAGVIAVLGMARAVEREDEPDLHLFATITFTVADLDGPPPESIPDAEVSPIEFNGPAGTPYRGVRVLRLRTANVPDQLSTTFLTVQYMMDTGHGVLATTFATPQRDFENLTVVLDKIASACWLEPPEG